MIYLYLINIYVYCASDVINFYFAKMYIYIYIYIQGVPGGKDLTSGECSLGQTIPI